MENRWTLTHCRRRPNENKSHHVVTTQRTRKGKEYIELRVYIPLWWRDSEQWLDYRQSEWIGSSLSELNTKEARLKIMQGKVRSHAQGQEAVASWAGGGRPPPSEDKTNPMLRITGRPFVQNSRDSHSKYIPLNTNQTSNYTAHAISVQSLHFYGIIYPE